MRNILTLRSTSPILTFVPATPPARRVRAQERGTRPAANALQRRILAATDRSLTIAAALSEAGLSHDAVMAECERDPRFAAAWALREQRRGRLIESLLSDKVITILTSKEASDSAVRGASAIGQWLLENRLPDRFNARRPAQPSAPRAGGKARATAPSAAEPPAEDPVRAIRIDTMLQASLSRRQPPEDQLSPPESPAP